MGNIIEVNINTLEQDTDAVRDKMEGIKREVAKLAAFGMSNKEIAEKLNMSLAGVKQALVAVTDKTGVGRDRFAAFL